MITRFMLWLVVLLTDTYSEVFVYDVHLNWWDKLPLSGHRRGILQIIDGNLMIFGGLDSATKKNNK